MKPMMLAVILLGVLIPAPWVLGQEASPYIIGVWKPDAVNGIDTEFRFLNPTNQTLTLEYAFFEEGDAFCGCDRDTLTPNKTVVYTASGEKSSNLMT